MSLNAAVGAGASKAWVGGFVAAISVQLGPVLYDGIEWVWGMDIPDDLESGLVTLTAALLGWVGVWLTPNITESPA